MQALHLDIAPGRRFALWFRPEATARRLIVHVHAFAEEMNKSRRMVALQARALAADGAAVLVPDLFGCGDSDGELLEARWTNWTDDVVAACEWARRELTSGETIRAAPECWLWGHRLGALLAAAAVPRLPGVWNLLFWQPVILGRQAVQQFLRLDGAAALVGKSRDADRPSAKSLLTAGQPARIAGYDVAPQLIEAIGVARLEPLPRPARMVWLEVSGAAGAGMSAAVEAAFETWRIAGWTVHHERVVGPAFWQTTEIEEAPALVAATRGAILGARTEQVA
jgi:exosortase A-associated hydrolase 2